MTALADAMFDAGRRCDAAGRALADGASREIDGVTHETQRLAEIGVRAGDLAHDFNNLLATILGHGERALSGAARGTPLRHDLENILAASRRGRALVEQMLAVERDPAIDHATLDLRAVV